MNVQPGAKRMLRDLYPTDKGGLKRAIQNHNNRLNSFDNFQSLIWNNCFDFRYDYTVHGFVKVTDQPQNKYLLPLAQNDCFRHSIKFLAQELYPQDTVKSEALGQRFLHKCIKAADYKDETGFALGQTAYPIASGAFANFLRKIEGELADREVKRLQKKKALLHAEEFGEGKRFDQKIRQAQEQKKHLTNVAEEPLKLLDPIPESPTIKPLSKSTAPIKTKSFWVKLSDFFKMLFRELFCCFKKSDKIN